jgi:hypothetical protein
VSSIEDTRIKWYTKYTKTIVCGMKESKSRKELLNTSDSMFVASRCILSSDSVVAFLLASRYCQVSPSQNTLSLLVNKHQYHFLSGTNEPTRNLFMYQSAASTPPIPALYFFTTSGHLTSTSPPSEVLPLFNLRAMVVDDFCDP